MRKGKIYSMKNSTRMLKTTQSSVVIPTAELVKNKTIDLRVLACISAISNVDNWAKKGSNERYCSIAKLNKNLDSISELLKMDRKKLMRSIRRTAGVGSSEFMTIKRECENQMTSCVEIRYGSGGFVTMECGVLEELVSTLSKNAFKLYVNLLWLCKDTAKNVFVERQLTQEFLLELIGLSKTSKRRIKEAEDELIENKLIEVSTKWEVGMNEDLTSSIPITKKYYKIV